MSLQLGDGEINTIIQYRLQPNDDTYIHIVNNILLETYLTCYIAAKVDKCRDILKFKRFVDVIPNLKITYRKFKRFIIRRFTKTKRDCFNKMKKFERIKDFLNKFYKQYIPFIEVDFHDFKTITENKDFMKNKRIKFDNLNTFIATLTEDKTRKDQFMNIFDLFYNDILTNQKADILNKRDIDYAILMNNYNILNDDDKKQFLETINKQDKNIYDDILPFGENTDDDILPFGEKKDDDTGSIEMIDLTKPKPSTGGKRQHTHKRRKKEKTCRKKIRQHPSTKKS